MHSRRLVVKGYSQIAALDVKPFQTKHPGNEGGSGRLSRSWYIKPALRAHIANESTLHFRHCFRLFLGPSRTTVVRLGEDQGNQPQRRVEQETSPRHSKLIAQRMCYGAWLIPDPGNLVTALQNHSTMRKRWRGCLYEWLLNCKI